MSAEDTVGASDQVELRGHVLDSGQLARVLDEILGAGADYVIDRFDVGKRPEDDSYLRMTVSAATEERLGHLLGRLMAYGANLTEPGEAVLVVADQDGVFPEDFYSTTNLETQVRVEGRWLPVANPEMDCGIVVSGPQARTRPDERRPGRRPGRVRRQRRPRGAPTARGRRTTRPSSS